MLLNHVSNNHLRVLFFTRDDRIEHVVRGAGFASALHKYPPMYATELMTYNVAFKQWDVSQMLTEENVVYIISEELAVNCYEVLNAHCTSYAISYSSSL
jgi:hypothetical protein